MNGNYLLDSNAIINIFRGDQNAISRTKKITIVHLPVIVIGELFYGAHKANRTPERILQIEKLEETVIILDITKKNGTDLRLDQRSTSGQGEANFGKRHLDCCACQGAWSYFTY
ncbi:PIN domain-containing protein [Flavilitoribacter nigricans]|nr:PIN domain-containing protein [Flavilitoribacter nigricans]